MNIIESFSFLTTHHSFSWSEEAEIPSGLLLIKIPPLIKIPALIREGLANNGGYFY